MMKQNQDCYVCTPNFVEGDAKLHFFGVFDGHGTYGDWCSQFAREAVASNMLKLLSEKTPVVEAYCKSFIVANEQMHSPKDRLSGTTAITVLFDGTTIHCANIGDSRAIMAHEEGKRLKAVPLSMDQTPYRRDERDRVRKVGARVLNMDQLEGLEPIHDNWDLVLGEGIDDGGDPPRIWHRTQRCPGAAFTRSMGDQVAETLGVFAEPEIVSKELHPDDKFIVIASDGVWEFLTSQAVVNMVDNYGVVDRQAACRHIVAESYRQWLTNDVRTDDITMILIDLKFDDDHSHDGSANGIEHLPTVESMRPARRGVSKAKRRHLESIHHAEIDEGDEQFILEDHIVEKTDEEIKMIENSTKSNFLFSHLNPDQLLTAYNVMQRKAVKKGERLITQGSKGDFLYIVESGDYSVFVTPTGSPDTDGLGELVHQYHGTEDSDAPCFGDLALLYRKPRAASVVADTDGSCWRISRLAFKAIIQKTDHGELVAVLRKVKVLEDLTRAQLTRLTDVLSEVTYEPGAVVVKQGEMQHDFYIVMSGGLRGCALAEDGSETRAMNLKHNDYFNEQALLEDAKSPVTITAVQKSKVLHIDRDQFDECLGHLADIIAEHAKKRAVRQQIARIAVDDDVSLFQNFDRLKPFCGKWNDEQAYLSVVRHHDHKDHYFTMRTSSKYKIAKAGQEKEAMKEKDILSLISHDIPFFPEFISTFSDDTCLHTLYHFTGASNLATTLGESDSFGEANSRFIASGLVLALGHLHGHGIISRSVVPEGIVLDNHGYPRMLDFRLSREIDDGDKAVTVCGTPDYLAPEIILPERSGYDSAVDLWALGCMVYEMLVGKSPFAGFERESDIEMWNRISEHKSGCITGFPADVSAEAQDFVQKLLEPDPVLRKKMFQATKSHTWFKETDWAGLAKSTAPSPLKQPTDASFAQLFETEMMISELFDSGSFSPRDVSALDGF
jgi:serine/threonine protein phosphatase PrpC/CRP-like cAMP-binding protein